MKQILGRKVGMTRVFEANGTEVMVTVIEVQPHTVIGHRTKDKDGYEAVIVGVEDYGKKRVPGQIAGQFPEGVSPKRVIRELQQEETPEVGQTLDASVFAAGDVVKVTGNTKGRGFAGVVRRHGFGGGPNTHGSMNHRLPGSMGQSAWPSRVLKGTRGGGRMGNAQRTIKGLKVVEADPERNLLVIRGGVPGARGGLVTITSDERYEA